MYYLFVIARNLAKNTQNVMFLFFEHIEHLQQSLQFAHLQTNFQIQNNQFNLNNVVDGFVFLVELVEQPENLFLFMVEKQQ